MNKEKWLIVSILVCGLLGVVGFSFAYFVSGVTIVGEGSSVTEMNPAEFTKVTYDAGSSALNLPNAVPGTTGTKDFTVKIEPPKQDTVTYAIKLKINENTFVTCNDSTYVTGTNECDRSINELTYTLKEGNTVIGTGDLAGVSSDVELVKLTKNVSSTVTYNYSLTVEFKRTNSDQNHNVNKVLSSNLVVEFAK